MQILRYGPPVPPMSQTATPTPSARPNRDDRSPAETADLPDDTGMAGTPRDACDAGDVLSSTDAAHARLCTRIAPTKRKHDDGGNEGLSDDDHDAPDGDIPSDTWRIGSPALDQLRRSLIGARNAHRNMAVDAPPSADTDKIATTQATEALARKRRESSMPAFAESIQRVSNQYRVVIGLRRPNAMGQSLLREGFPTKNFHVKAKSSAAGPTAGFVPIEPKYAKIGVEQWAKQANAIASALKSGAKAVNLRLSPARVKELVTLGAMTHAGGATYRATYPGGAMTFSLRPSSPDSPDTLTVFDTAGRPVTVLTNPPELPGGFAKDKALTASPLPMTADYDLFCLFSRRERDVDRFPMPVQPHVVAGPRDRSRNRASQYLDAVATGQTRPEDPNMGNIPFFHRTIVDALNVAVTDDGYRGGKLFWHNAENGNPFSPGFASDDAPLFFVPGTPHPMTASTLDDLNGVIDRLQTLGYAAKLSPRLAVNA
ncbi:Bifunctional hemolysin/adenylate cyclase [Pandoraea capi]|uniref:Bifunctional hemolysin/adenylate cyclase n=1 Tax=Pandoraea capi TaxID=2508286 RepID=A0ABY6VLN6_9BURK|nr:anthrax toxin-like adenylyl cyclase domain-containing protein [Pandoraea capi]VVD61498.1 Bifunctional hemolysin/adenylate cyclase [Pandoraea capi]